MWVSWKFPDADGDGGLRSNCSPVERLEWRNSEEASGRSLVGSHEEVLLCLHRTDLNSSVITDFGSYAKARELVFPGVTCVVYEMTHRRSG